MTSSKILAYLGPAGSFTHQAAERMCPDGVELQPFGDLSQVISALMTGQADYAVAAINSAAGPIEATVDVLKSGQVLDLGRTHIDVSFDLYRKPGEAETLEGVIGHEKALAQIHHWIEQRDVQTEQVESNTLGLQMIADGRPAWGAVGPPGLAQKFGLEVVAQALDSPNRNQTEFVLMTRQT